MPSVFPFTRAAMALACTLVLTHSALAQTEPASRVANSSLNAPLFYQLLKGEMELRAGQAGEAFEDILDAARKTRDESLFRRATEIALQTRAGDSALVAVQAWRGAVPESQIGSASCRERV